jgi:hypothetical protein
MDKVLILAEVVAKLKKQIQELSTATSEVKKLEGPKGADGKDGKDGVNGKDGTNGINGRDGLDGKDGKDGVDGKNGVGVEDAYIDFDNSLVIKLTNGKEINAGFLEKAQQDLVIQSLKNGALSLNELLPSQAGNANELLTTDGTNASWTTPLNNISVIGVSLIMA